jgi:hypothetical protein
MKRLYLFISQNNNLKIPTIEDGMSVFNLVERCPPLDPNSSYSISYNADIQFYLCFLNQ